MINIRPVVATAAVAGLSLIGFVGMPTAALAASHHGKAHSYYCHGHKATIVGHGHVKGTKHADVIVLTGPSTVDAGAGNDIVCGSSGHDVINAGTGNDKVYGNGGNDVENGGAGNDTLNLSSLGVVRTVTLTDTTADGFTGTDAAITNIFTTPGSPATTQGTKAENSGRVSPPTPAAEGRASRRTTG